MSRTQGNPFTCTNQGVCPRNSMYCNNYNRCNNYRNTNAASCTCNNHNNMTSSCPSNTIQSRRNDTCQNKMPSNHSTDNCDNSPQTNQELLQWKQQLMNLCRQDLLCCLSQVSFSMFDMSLYLDTHPEDQDALSYFQKMKQKRETAMHIYTKKYGPLTVDCADAYCPWDWGNAPLPWH